MKISPLAQGSAMPVSSELGQTISPDKIARAKEIAGGRKVTEIPQEDKQVDRIQNNIKKIKFNTQQSTNRHETEQEQPVEVAPVVEQQAIESPINDTSEQVDSATEETKPLSPQFAALAKAKRMLQEEKKAFEAEKLSLKQNQEINAQDFVKKADLKANPLSILEEQGFTRDQIAELLLASPEQNNPAVSRLEAEIKALKEGLENQNKSQSERDQAAKQQVLAQMARDADKIIAQGDDYEMIRETNSRQDVIRLIEKTFDETGEVLELEEALSLVENELIEESLKIARIKKVQSQLTPAQQQIQPQDNKQGVRTMRTLTNRDGASVPVSARERAINAFHGLKK